jgi:hypothetical protein
MMSSYAARCSFVGQVYDLPSSGADLVIAFMNAVSYSAKTAPYGHGSECAIRAVTVGSGELEYFAI